MVVAAARSLRIVALPLTRATAVHPALTYYQFITPPPAQDRPPSLFKRATDKAASVWAGFGKADEGNWRLKIFRYGERLIDRIDFEELALKSLDPSLGPKLSKFGEPGVKLEEKERPTISLIYPQASPSPLAHLHTLVQKRKPLHRKGLWTWVIISPFTIPFALIPLIPVIPNLPLFYCIWRSWSHYRAWKASEYLESLVERGAIMPEPSPELEAVYAEHRQQVPVEDESPQTLSSETEKVDSSSNSAPHPHPTSKPAPDKPDLHPDLLLARSAIAPILKLFDLQSKSAADMYRAIEQAGVRLNKDESR